MSAKGAFCRAVLGSPELSGVRRCQQLMYMFPVLRWLKVFSQTWEGDVTMVLPSSYMQLKKSVTNPTNKDLLDACKQVLPACPLRFYTGRSYTVRSQTMPLNPDG